MDDGGGDGDDNAEERREKANAAAELDLKYGNDDDDIVDYIDDIDDDRVGNDDEYENGDMNLGK